MKSFKYKGTPEQMAKVAEWLLSKGYEGINKGVSDDALYFYGSWNGSSSGIWQYLRGDYTYHEHPFPPMPPVLELEIFGKTENSLITEDAWKENTGVQPVDNDVLVDTRWEETGLCDDFGQRAGIWTWGVGGGISQWRFHKPEDAKYYVQPATELYKLEETKEPVKEKFLENAYDQPSVYGDIELSAALADSDIVKGLVASLNALTPSMSYNDSYFGEAAGYIKGAIRELDHIINADSYGKPVVAAYKEPSEEVPVKRNKYMREIKPGVYCDVYDVIRAFTVTDGALQHLLKKALAVGQRGHKDAATDYKDIVDSAKRAQEIYLEWNK